MADKLEAWLREKGELYQRIGQQDYRDRMNEAADEITRLNAENEELRAALKPLALAPIGSGKEPPEPFPSDDTQVAFIANVTFGDFRKLRALITKASRDSGHG